MVLRGVNRGETCVQYFVLMADCSRIVPFRHRCRQLRKYESSSWIPGFEVRQGGLEKSFLVPGARSTLCCIDLDFSSHKPHFYENNRLWYYKHHEQIYQKLMQTLKPPSKLCVFPARESSSIMVGLLGSLLRLTLNFVLCFDAKLHYSGLNM